MKNSPIHPQEQALNEGLNEMSEGELIRWMNQIAYWLPIQIRQDILFAIVSIASAMCELRRTRERKITLARIRHMGIMGRSWSELDDLSDEIKADTGGWLGLTNETEFRTQWEKTYRLRPEMVANFTWVSELGASDLFEVLGGKSRSSSTKIEDKIIATRVSHVVIWWCANEFEGKSLESITEHWSVRGANALRERLLSKETPYTYSQEDETHLDRWIGNAKKAYANAAVGLAPVSLGQKFAAKENAEN
jgi:hypothetical protein